MKRSIKRTWEEEEVEFRQVVRAVDPKVINPGPFGQTIPDAIQPTTKFKDNDLTEFLVPESHLSLKLYFDNLRNFAICGGVGAFGGWVWSGMSGRWSVVPMPVMHWFAVAVWVLAAIYLVFNILQARVLLGEARYSLQRIRSARITVHGPDTDLFVMLLNAVFWLLVRPLVWLIWILLPFIVVGVSIGFAAFGMSIRVGP